MRFVMGSSTPFCGCQKPPPLAGNAHHGKKPARATVFFWVRGGREFAHFTGSAKRRQPQFFGYYWIPKRNTSAAASISSSVMAVVARPLARQTAESE
jgi:hypothetical protein